MRSAAATFPVAEPVRAGVGLRLPHLAEVAADPPQPAWVEIHPENFLANAHARELLQSVACRCRISMHTVGISISSAEGVDREHIARVRRLVDEVDPFLISGHLAWSVHAGTYLNDLLPLPYDEEALRTVSAHVDEVQQRLGRRYLVENPASYVGFARSTMTEVEFLSALADRTGCGLLCDVSNVVVSAANMGFDAHAYIDAFPAQAVVELHLGGYTAEHEAQSPAGGVLIDTHAAPIAAPARELYAHAVRRFGPRPTLIEWDNELPAFETLLTEAARADVVAAAALEMRERHAVAG